MKKVLVFAIHPDDETLGCGGTLLKHKEAGDEIHWLIGTEVSVEDGFKKAFRGNWGAQERTKRPGVVQDLNRQ